MFDLYFSYNDALSKKIILFIYNNKINEQLKINFINVNQYNEKYNKIPLLIDHNNKKIVEKNKIFNYLIEYFNQLKKKTDKKETFDNTEKQVNHSMNHSTNQPKPYIVCENKLTSIYGFVNFL